MRRKRGADIALNSWVPEETTLGFGASTACAQHSVPQPAAQGQPLWLSAGSGARSLAACAEQMLVAKGAAAIADNGSNTACSATT